jgi:hypothetical protein
VIFITDKQLQILYPDFSPNLLEFKMKVNEGTIDRALRVIVGLVLITLAATETVGPWGWIGLLPLLTGAVGICPAYSILGMNTCPAKK